VCQKIVRPLLNDPDKKVRNELCRLFHKPGCLIDSSLKIFITEYIHSSCFADDPDIFIWTMKDYTGSVVFLADIIFDLCDVFSSKLKTESRDVSTIISHSVSETVPLLLRLYENALSEENKEVSNLCLDKWDMLFENRVGIAKDLTKAIEQ
ncbi:MAG: hypothetical protein ACQES8_04345, partial [Thermodesulfobacteriota bacterium]